MAAYLSPACVDEQHQARPARVHHSGFCQHIQHLGGAGQCVVTAGVGRVEHASQAGTGIDGFPSGFGCFTDDGEDRAFHWIADPPRRRHRWQRTVPWT